MTSLYELSPELQKKYAKSLELNKDKAFVRYDKKFFELLSKGHDEYAPLFSAFELGVEERVKQALHYNPDKEVTMDCYREGHTVSLSKQEYHMYLNFIEHVILIDLKEPPNNAKLMITTHDGGTSLAYYRNKRYEVPMGSGLICIEEGVVIYWVFYEER